MKTKSVRQSAKAKQIFGEAKLTHHRLTPNARKAIADAVATPSLPESISSRPSSAPTPPPNASITGAVLFRKLCEEKLAELYPGLEARSDFDLVQLTNILYKGTPAEIYAQLDKDLVNNVETHGYEFIMNAATKLLDTYVEPTGIKPRDTDPESKYVFIRPIPDSKYSLRLFPGSISAAEYCLDFVETATGKPVNSPFEYELWGVPNPDADTPWLCIPMVGRLRTIEHGHGIKQKDVVPGAEKFVLRDGQTCVLARPGKRSLRFTVPVRKMEAPAVVDDMDVVDLPKYILP